MMYGAEAWAVTRRDEGLLERTEMIMLRCILGFSLKDKARVWNEVTRKSLRGAFITDKIRQAMAAD